MNLYIKDANGDALPERLAPLEVRVNSVTPLQLTIVCQDGWQLAISEANADLAIRAKKSTDVAWTNLEITPVDLSADAGDEVLYDFEITAGPTPLITEFPIDVRPIP